MPIDESRAAQAIRALLESFDADPDCPELEATPARVAAFWQERLAGYDIDLEAELKPLPGDLAPCPVILEGVPFVSTCEHHLAPFVGTVTLGYLPGEGGTVGLSKLVRVVQAYAWRLQVQERMTRQIAEALEQYLLPSAWAVKVVAEHTCISHRGVRTPGIPVSTVILGGEWSVAPPAAFR
ncbi:MAG TPA: GTP cyclohydrolase I [Holophagaceae bacterium]|nr:GTP cyclohydrolase I [Holophagaceae bacterium]